MLEAHLNAALELVGGSLLIRHDAGNVHAPMTNLLDLTMGEVNGII